jgi:hypothetical protein
LGRAAVFRSVYRSGVQRRAASEASERTRAKARARVRCNAMLGVTF